jgi:tetratricopeptide (TPR) repeat protein
MKLLLWLVLLGSMALIAPPAHAQDQNKLRALFAVGAQAYKQGKFLEAVVAFEEAYKLSPRPQLLFSAAQALRRQHAVDGKVEHLEKAIEYYRKYLEFVPEGGRRLDAAKGIEELVPLVSRESGGGSTSSKTAKPATRLMITTQVEDAQVVLDGGKQRAMPLIEEVKPGDHVVVVSAPGYHKLKRRVVAFEGAVVAMELELKPRPARLSILGRGGEVLVDGESEGELPLGAPLELSADRHVITVLETGHEPFTQEIELERGEQRKLEVNLHRTRLRGASYVVIATGAAALVAGAVLGGAAIAKEIEAKDIDEARQRGEARSEADRLAYNAAIASRNDMRLAAGITAAAGAVIGGAGVALFFLDEPAPPPLRLPERESVPEEQRSLEISLGNGDTWLGATLSGRF